MIVNQSNFHTRLNVNDLLWLQIEKLLIASSLSTKSFGVEISFMMSLISECYVCNVTDEHLVK